MNSWEFDSLKIKKDTGKGCLQGFIWEMEAPSDGLLSKLILKYISITVTNAIRTVLINLTTYNF